MAGKVVAVAVEDGREGWMHAQFLIKGKEMTWIDMPCVRMGYRRHRQGKKERLEGGKEGKEGKEEKGEKGKKGRKGERGIGMIGELVERDNMEKREKEGDSENNIHVDHQVRHTPAISEMEGMDEMVGTVRLVPADDRRVCQTETEEVAKAKEG